MKSTVVSYVGWLLLVSALGFYLYGIIEAVSLSLGKKPIGEGAFPPMLAATVSSMQALLLTNLGILLGISIAKPESGVARQLLLGSSSKERLTGEIKDPLELREKIQLFALVVYVVSLIICLIVWIKNDFSSKPEEVVSLISESGKMFFGVMLAYLTAVLGKQ